MSASRLALATLVVISWLAGGCDLIDEPSSTQGAIAPPSTAPPTRARELPPQPTATMVVPATPAPTALRPTPSATVTATRAPTGTEPRAAASGYRRFVSTRLPYAVDYLETWQPRGDASFQGGQGDLFSGATAGQSTSHVTVVQMPIAAGTSSGLVFEAGLAELAEAGIRPSEEVERTVSGDDALVVSYQLQRDGQTLAVTQALVVRPAKVWAITLTTTPGELDRLAPVFSHMLDSFQPLD